MVQDNKPDMRKESLSDVARSVPTTRYNSRPVYREPRGMQIGCGILAVSAAVTIGLGSYGLYQVTHPSKDVTVTVTDKVVKNDGNSSTYLIFTDKGVYEDSDSMLNGKWNSSDIYNQLKKGKTYRLHVRGIRNHFLSWYPNILSVYAVKSNKVN